MIGKEPGTAGRDQGIGRHPSGLRACQGDRRRMAALLPKSPETGQPFHIRHFQIKGDGIERGKPVCEVDALGKAGREMSGDEIFR